MLPWSLQTLIGWVLKHEHIVPIFIFAMTRLTHSTTSLGWKSAIIEKKPQYQSIDSHTTQTMEQQDLGHGYWGYKVISSIERRKVSEITRQPPFLCCTSMSQNFISKQVWNPIVKYVEYGALITAKIDWMSVEAWVFHSNCHFGDDWAHSLHNLFGLEGCHHRKGAPVLLNQFPRHPDNGATRFGSWIVWMWSDSMH